MLENNSINVDDPTGKAIILIDDWLLPPEVVLYIFGWLKREDLFHLCFVSKYTAEFIRQNKDALTLGLAPLGVCTTLTTNRKKERQTIEEQAVAPVNLQTHLEADTVATVELRRHWQESDTLFRRLCNVRSISYLYSPRTDDTDHFADVIAKSTIQKLKSNQPSFLQNPYLRDLVILTLLIEVYYRDHDFVVEENENHPIKVSDLIELLFENQELNFSDPASSCLYIFFYLNRTHNINNVDRHIRKHCIRFLMNQIPNKYITVASPYDLTIKSPAGKNYNFTFDHYMNSTATDLNLLLLLFYIKSSNLLWKMVLIPHGELGKIYFANRDLSILKYLLLLPVFRRTQLLCMPYRFIYVLVKHFEPNDFFTRLDTFSKTGETSATFSAQTVADVYINALIYLFSHKDILDTIDWYLNISNTSFSILHAQIITILKLTNDTQLFSSAHICLLLLFNPLLKHMTIEFLIDLLGIKARTHSCLACSKEKSPALNASLSEIDSNKHILGERETTLHLFFTLEANVINYVSNNKKNKRILEVLDKCSTDLLHAFFTLDVSILKYLINDEKNERILELLNQYHTKQIQAFFKIFKLGYIKILLLFEYDFLDPVILSRLCHLRLHFINTLLALIPETPLTLECAQTLLIAAKNLPKKIWKSKSSIERLDNSLSKIYEYSPPSLAEIAKAVTFPIFWAIGTSPFYIELFKMVGIDNFDFCYTNSVYIKIKDQHLMSFLEQLYWERHYQASSIHFQEILSIIREAGATNHRDDIARRINEYLNCQTPLPASTQSRFRYTLAAVPQYIDPRQLLSRSKSNHQSTTIIPFTGVAYPLTAPPQLIEQSQLSSAPTGDDLITESIFSSKRRSSSDVTNSNNINSAKVQKLSEHEDSKTSAHIIIAISNDNKLLDNNIFTADLYNSAINSDANESSEDDNDNTNPPNKQSLSLPHNIVSPYVIESSDSEGDWEEDADELASRLYPRK